MATKKTTDVDTTVDVTAEVVAENEQESSTASKQEENTVAETSYAKEQIIESKRYSKYVDILNTVLGNRKYTFTEVDSLLNDFLNKEVE
jgi:hypothetical protein